MEDIVNDLLHLRTAPSLRFQAVWTVVYTGRSFSLQALLIRTDAGPGFHHGSSSFEIEPRDLWAAPCPYLPTLLHCTARRNVLAE
jgi:hypothetical protein